MGPSANVRASARQKGIKKRELNRLYDDAYPITDEAFIQIMDNVISRREEPEQDIER